MGEEQQNWSSFQDNKVTKQYQDFIKSKEFAKNQLKLSVSARSGYQDSWDAPPLPPPKGHGHVSTPTPTPTPVNEYCKIAYPNLRSLQLDEEKRHRRKRTISCVAVGILLLCIAALLASLLIHYLIIDKSDHHSALPGFGADRNNKSESSTTETPNATSSTSPPRTSTSIKPSFTITTELIPTVQVVTLEEEFATATTINTTTPVTTSPTTTITSDTSTFGPIVENEDATSSTSPPRTSTSIKPSFTITTELIPTVQVVTLEEAFATATTINTTTPVTASPTTTITSNTSTVGPIVENEAMVTLNNASISLGEPLTLICNLVNGGAWKSISILQIKPTFSLLVTLHSGANASNVWPDPRLTSTFTMDGNNVELNLEMTKTGCADHGEYRCSVELEDRITFDLQHVIINEPFKIPEVFASPFLIEKELTEISANWTLGPKHSVGQVSWEIMSSNDTEFKKVDVNDFTQTPNRRDCATVFENTFLVYVKPMLNDTLLRIKIESVVDENGISATYISDPVFLLVVPADICQGVPAGSFIDHPYTCTQYIECGNTTITVKDCLIDECFDQFTAKCVSLLP